jgi:hypothetical protein
MKGDKMSDKMKKVIAFQIDRYEATCPHCLAIPTIKKASIGNIVKCGFCFGEFEITEIVR